MTADGGADTVDQHPAVQMREALFDQVGDGSGVLPAGRIRDIAFAAVCTAFFDAFLHLVHDSLNDLAFGADLVAGDQLAEVVDIQQRTDAQHTADKTGGPGDAAAFNIEGKVC